MLQKCLTTTLPLYQKCSHNPAIFSHSIGFHRQEKERPKAALKNTTFGLKTLFSRKQKCLLARAFLQRGQLTLSIVSSLLTAIPILPLTSTRQSPHGSTRQEVRHIEVPVTANISTNLLTIRKELSLNSITA